MLTSEQPVGVVDRSQKGAGKDPHDYWWREAEGQLHSSIFNVCRSILTDQRDRQQAHLEYYKLYRNKPPSFWQRAVDSKRVNRRVTYNVVKSCIDTAAAKISKNKPRPLFMTSGADWSLQERAKKLTKYMDGLFVELDLYELGQAVFRDACVFDGGAVKLFVEDGRIKAERVIPTEILVDEGEAYYGKPRQMHHRRFMARTVLAEMFPEHADKIQHAPPAKIDVATHGTTPAMVEVVESWHLPSATVKKGDGGKYPETDGKHAIVIEGETLFEEPYYKDWFPFVFYHWSEPLSGFWGGGLSEELSGLQAEINEVLRRISTALRFAATPKCLIPYGAKVNKAAINNSLEVPLIEFDPSAGPPQWLVSQAMNSETYQYVETLVNKAFQMTGISMLSAQSQKPAGLNAAVALDTFTDIESERFILVGQRYENFFMECARRLVELSRDVYEDDPKFAVKSRAGKFIESIEWKDVDLDDDEFDMKVFPVSMLPTTPAGKLQTVSDMLEKGMLDPQTAMSLLDFPDLDSVVNLQTASRDVVMMVLDHMKNGGNYIPPEPFMDLELAKKLGLWVYFQSKTQKVGEDALENLRTFLTEVVDLQAKAQPPPAPPGPPPGPMPPMPTPMGPPPGEPMPMPPQGAPPPMPMPMPAAA